MLGIQVGIHWDVDGFELLNFFALRMEFLEYNIKNGTGVDQDARWTRSNTLFLVIASIVIPLIVVIMSVLMCKVYALRRLVTPFSGFGQTEEGKAYANDLELKPS